MSTDAVVPAQAIPEGMKPVTKFTAEHAHEVGLPSPEAINYMMSIAGMLVNSALISKDMGLSKDQVDQYRQMGWTPEQINSRLETTVKANAMAKMLVGREMRMEAMESLQDVDIVKGRIFVRYPQLIRQMELKGYKLKQIQRDHERAAIEVTRPSAEPEVFEFTIEDAKRAGLTESYRSGEKSQYEKRPRVMLWARVVSEAFRGTGGRGNIYTPEEKAEILASEGEPTEREQAEAAADRAAEENPALRLEKRAVVMATNQTTSGAGATISEKAEEPVLGNVQKLANAPVVENPETPAEPSKVREPRKPKPSAPAKQEEAPLPAEAEPVHAQSNEKQEAFASQMALNARASKILEKVPGGDLLGVAKLYFGYFGSLAENMPKTWEQYYPVLDLFEKWITLPGAVDKFLKDPEKFGKVLRDMETVEAAKAAPQPEAAAPSKPEQKQEVSDDNPLAKEFGWGPETVKAATAVMTKYKMPVEKIRVNMKGFGLLGATEDLVRTTFILWYHSADAILMKRRGAEKGLDMLQCAAKVTARVGHPITLESNTAAVQSAVLSTLTELSTPLS